MRIYVSACFFPRREFTLAQQVSYGFPTVLFYYPDTAEHMIELVDLLSST